jgi:cellulose synthase/poly-beta-1,6-N-acetylglucosamine synthase-like glycosyltransferase
MSLPLPALDESRLTPLTSSDKARSHGKFFFVGENKLFLKGVTYGPFSPSQSGVPFPDASKVEFDFALMTEAGINCVRTFTPPPPSLLDAAAAYGLRVITGIPWAQHICFLDSARARTEIRSSIESAVKACKGHPAIQAYLVGNEISPEMVRWHGPHRVRGFLHELFDTAKSIDPDTFVSYANFPSTEYLEIDFMDFVAFNVYLHREQDFRRYLAHLQNLAGDRPLVLTEIGIDSIREGRKAQAKILSWQVRASFEAGVAGTVIFSWTDDWHAYSGPEGFQVEDWAFGLVDRQRRHKPAFWAVKSGYDGPLPPTLSAYPRVSVIVCAYNAERTMDRCLASLEKLNYLNFEVIVVNDGSTDATREICERYDFVHLINQDNQGLSAARNIGLNSSTGEIVAYTDSDCMADPDWLTYLVARFQSSTLGAIGGPNLPPPDESLVPSCVAVSPGAPTHVLLDDEVAEHIPGCNMAFRRDVLESIGGFDPVFRTAGDDVDVCWRLQNKGYKIGFDPAAVVWHFRRNTVRDYLKQQRGYGKAEALLYFKHPYRFNILGQSRWFGRIYGDISSFLLSLKPRIYSGVFGRGLFQTLYQPPASLGSYIPLTLEWNLVSVALIACAFFFGDYFWLGLAPLCLTFTRCLMIAHKARVDSRFSGPRATLLVTLLIFLGPLVRALERYRWRIRRFQEVKPVGPNGAVQPPRVSWLERAFYLAYWNENGQEKESLLHGVMESLLPRKYLIAVDQGWSRWDLEICQGPWAKAQVRVATENHGGTKRLLRVRCAIRLSRVSIACFCAYVFMATLAGLLDLPTIAATSVIIGLVHGGAIVHQKFHIGNALYHVVESVAHRLRFVAVDQSLKT